MHSPGAELRREDQGGAQGGSAGAGSAHEPVAGSPAAVPAAVAPALPVELPPSLFPADLGGFGAQIEALCQTLGASAAERDKAGGTAFEARRLLRDSGLLALAVPKEHGGLGARWPLIFAAARRIARADSSMAHLFGFQHLQVASVLLFGSVGQQHRYLSATAAQRWFWGNAVNARDTRLKAVRVEGGWRLDGVKAFCSGARDSDVLNVSIASGPAPTDRLYLVVPTSREGIEVHDDWDNMGQRQTDSGSVSFRGVFAGDDEVLGPPGAASSPRATLRNVIGQIILTEIYLGNAQGALEDAVAYLRTQAQPWVMAGVARAVDDAMLQRRAGELWAALRAATSLSDEANAAFERAWSRGLALEAEERGALSTLVAAARRTAARTALQVTSEMFELMGARATTARYGHDRYWRNVRVHTVHDPLDYRSKEIGRWLFTGEAPDPYGYG